MYKVSNVYKPLLFFIDLIGYIMIYPFIQKRLERIKKILIIRVDHIGDFVMTTPMFKTIKKNLPSVKLHILCRRLTKELAENDQNIDKFFVYDPPWFLRKEGNDSFLKIVQRLRKEKYDLVIDPHADPRNIFLGKLVGRLVLSYPIRGFGFLLFKRPNYPDKHMIENNLFLLETLGLKICSKQPYIQLPRTMDKTMERFLRSKPICINPGSGRKEKEWPLENWVKLIKMLSKQYTVILTGSKTENETNEKIASQTGAVNLTGKLSLLELACLLKHSRLFIGPDTGSMHIAKAMKTPIIALFGPTDPTIWGYTQPPNMVIKKSKTNEITVDEVLDKVFMSGWSIDHLLKISSHNT